MANTIMTAKNTFGEGLIMDFAPDNTQSNVLTSALNATLLTFNGNEMSLQNDMGNGRVETARLPDGYVPVGTCEFGDIIYIVSYNPILNKSQIGCFPSPERNISSTELGNTGTIISSLDFLVIQEGSPTGELVANTKKYILYEKALNPGDKYIIYNDGSDSIESNIKLLSDLYNESHVFGTLPRFLKLHVVSIEDSGKITYLDNTVKWYNNKGDLHYFIQDCLNSNYGNATGKVDLDSYRSLVSSAYSIFQSKISGKLAILAELEKINGFNCTYGVYSKGTKLENNTELKDYSIFLECNWSSDNLNINPLYLVLTASDWNKNTVLVYDKNGEVLLNQPYTIKNPPRYYISSNLSYWNTEITNYTEYWKSNTFEEYYKTCYTTKEAKYKSEHPKIIRVLNNVDAIGIPKEGEYLPITNKGIKCDNNLNYFYYNEKGEKVPIASEKYYDTLINNYFHYGVIKHFWDVTIPGKYIKKGEVLNGKKAPDEIYQYNKKDLIYHYQITPAMPYGLLSEYAIDGYIDFSKIGSGIIELLKWKYYNTANTTTLTFGFDVYPEPNKGVSEIVLEFYDNQGFAAAYHISGRKSYSGTFTETIPLNGSTGSYKLNAVMANGKNDNIHIGLPVSEADYNANPNMYVFSDGSKDGIPEGYYTNDCGTLYSGIVYFVKIIVKYDAVNALGEFKLDPNADYSATTYYRWLWTNLMYNEHYYDTEDFDILPVQLTLDLHPEYSSDYNYKIVDYSSPLATEDRLNNLGATILYINGKIKMKVIPGLLNTYKSFFLNKKEITDKIGITLYDGDLYIENSPEKVEVQHTGDKYSTDLTEILPVLSTDSDKDLNLTKLGPNCTRLLGTEIQGLGKELYEREIDTYKNMAKIHLSNTIVKEDGDLQYIPYKGEDPKSIAGLNCSYIGASAEASSYADIDIELLHFSKYYKEFGSQLLDVTALYPIIYTPLDLEKYGLTYKLSETESKDGHNIGHIYINYLINYNSYRSEKAHFKAWYNVLTSDVSGNFAISENLTLKQFGSNTWGYQSMFNELITSDDGEKVSSGVKRYPSLLDIMPEDLLTPLKTKKFILFAPTSTNLNFPCHMVIADSNPASTTGILKSYLNYYKKTSNVEWYNNSSDIASKIVRIKDAYKGDTTTAMVFLGYTGSENNNLHIFNNAFSLKLNGLLLSLATIVPFTIKDTPAKYWQNDGYDYYYFAIYWDLSDYSTGVGGALNGFKYKLYKFETDLLYRDNIVKWGNGTIVRDSYVYRCKSGDTLNIKILIPDFWDNNKIIDELTLTTSTSSSYYNNSKYISPSTIKVIALSNNGTIMFISGAPGNFKLEESQFATREETLSTYAGDMIVSALQSLYSIRGEEQIPSLDITDLAYLKPNTTLYTKEIICESKLPEITEDNPNHNDLIVINGSMHYGKYLDELKKVAINSLGDEKSKISYSNVNIIINNCLKTCPLQLVIEYKSPNMTIIGNIANAVVHTASGETILTTLNNIDSSVLYELNSENKLSKLSTGHTFTYAENFELIDKGDGEIIQAKLSKYLSKPNKYLKSTTGYDTEQLTMTKDSYDRTLVNSKYFGINFSLNNDSNHNCISGIYDNNKQEILLPELQVIQV